MKTEKMLQTMLEHMTDLAEIHGTLKEQKGNADLANWQRHEELKKLKKEMAELQKAHAAHVHKLEKKHAEAVELYRVDSENFSIAEHNNEMLNQRVKFYDEAIKKKLGTRGLQSIKASVTYKIAKLEDKLFAGEAAE